MLEKYTELLFVEEKTEAVINTAGTFVLPDIKWREHCFCKLVANGSNQLVKVGSGANYVFSYLIFLPITAEELILGTQIRICKPENSLTLAEGSVKRFFRGKMGCKVWI